jgi:hypothetical protein
MAAVILKMMDRFSMVIATILSEIKRVLQYQAKPDV